MRVAFLTHEPFHPPSGGGSAEAIYLVQQFVERGHEVHLFCPEFSDRESIASQFRITIHPFTRWVMGRYAKARNLKYLLYPGALAALTRRTLARLRQADSQFRFDLLFAQHTISAVAAGRLRGELQTPTIFNFLDYLTGFMETWKVLPRSVARALTRFEMSLPKRFRADGILTVSTSLAQRFLATGIPPERVQPIFYGYDASLFRPAESVGDTIPESSAPVILMHGSFDQHHLGPIARETICRVAEARPEVRFRFVGRKTPTLLDFADDVREQSLRANLDLVGFVPYEEVPQQVRAATVGLVPYEESNGTHCAFVAKAVECLGCGIPVASTPLDNLRRYFHDEPAIRFSGRFSGAELAAAVLAWLETDPAERRRLGASAAARVARELDWSVVTRRAVEFSERIAQRDQPQD